MPPADQLPEVVFHSLPVPFAVVGALIAARRPGNRIGLLLLAGALSLNSAQLSWVYANYGVQDGAPLPGQLPVAWLGNWIAWPTRPRCCCCCCCFPTAGSCRCAGAWSAGPPSSGAPW